MSLTIAGKITTDNRGSVYIGEDASIVTLTVEESFLKFHSYQGKWTYFENDKGHTKPVDISRTHVIDVLNGWVHYSNAYDVTIYAD